METREKREEIQGIKQLWRSEKNKVTAKRLLIVRLHLEGYEIRKIGGIADCCEKTVYNSINRYKSKGKPGLLTKPLKGREKKLTDVQEKELYETIKTKLPSEVGFAPFANWTSFLAVKWVKKEYGVEFSDRGMRNVFERLKLSYTRPTYVLKKADPEKQEAFKKEFEKVKKTDF
jgi:putative transposase